MEGIEPEEPYFSVDEHNGDLCGSILSRFGYSADENHQHLCAVIGAMSQEFKEQNLPSTYVAYFGAACSSLDRLSSENNAPRHIVDALLTILSIVIKRVPCAVLNKKREFLSHLLVQVLRSPSVAETSGISGLKCVSHLLVHRDGLVWSDVSQLFNVLLGFVTDSRPKVRRQSHLCLRDVLLSVQKAPLLERFLLLAGEGPQGAQQVLYILDALKECLPLMSLECKTSILEYFKPLLDLHQPLLTRRITDGLSFLCLSPASEFSPEAFLELLNSLALSISTNEMSGDVMTFAARLLDVGMNKVFTLNGQICVIKLPTVFNALKGVLSSKHEEAIYAATASFKSLIHSCIDESLIKQGVDQISLNAQTPKSGPTIIEKVCATIESMLDYDFDAVWDRVFQVVSAMFHKLGNRSTYFMRGIVTNLAVLQKLSDEHFPFRKQLHECLGSALVAMGPETFLSLLPLNLEADDLSNANIWLFPILKHYTVGACLSFFAEEILSMVGRLRQRSRQFELQGLMVSSRNADALAYSLWSLLPSFCNYPSDTAESFVDLERTLCITLQEEPDIRGIICTSLLLLIQQNKKIVDAKDDKKSVGGDMACEHGLVHYSKQVATSNLNVLKSSALELLIVLSHVFLMSTKDDGGCLQLTISEIASISDRAVISDSKLFKNITSKLLKVTQEIGKAVNTNSMQVDESSNDVSPSVVRAQLLDLAVSLLPVLNPEDIEVLYAAIKPTLKGDEGSIQKKGYKVLSVILRDSNEFIPSKLEELLALMVEVLPSCHISSRHHRLNCLYFLIVHVSKDNLERRWREIMSSFLTEIVLALKEANKKTRNRAYDILVEIGHALGDEERGGNRENLCKIFNAIAGCLVSETPHMISAAAKGLAGLAYEFSDLISTAFNLLPSTFLLLQRQNREIIKANLGLLKVLVAKSQPEWLQSHLKSVVEGLMKWQDNTKNHFRAKVKLLLEMLVRKCGLEAVKAVMPEDHMRLLTNICKIKERKERKRGAKTEETRSCLSKAPTCRRSMWNHTKFFSDFDEDSEGADAEYLNARTISRGVKSHSKSAAASFRSKIRHKRNLLEHLSDQSDDEPLDLLDRQKTISAPKSSEHLKRKSRLDDEVEVDSEGRLIIREEGDQRKQESSEPDFDATGEADSHLSGKSGTQVKKLRKTLDSGWAYTGSEYASKKASGDVKRKDKLEPYAYWPLDRKMMSRRPQHRATARKGMASVVKMTKRFEGKSASSVLSQKSLKLEKTKKKGVKK